MDCIPKSRLSVHTQVMIEVGDIVSALGGQFVGRVLGRHGSTGVGGSYEFRSLPDDLNLMVYAVISKEGEVRYFSDSAITTVGK